MFQNDSFFHTMSNDKTKKYLEVQLYNRDYIKVFEKLLHRWMSGYLE